MSGPEQLNSDSHTIRVLPFFVGYGGGQWDAWRTSRNVQMRWGKMSYNGIWSECPQTISVLLLKRFMPPIKSTGTRTRDKKYLYNTAVSTSKYFWRPSTLNPLQIWTVFILLGVNAHLTSRCIFLPSHFPLRWTALSCVRAILAVAWESFRLKRQRRLPRRSEGGSCVDNSRAVWSSHGGKYSAAVSTWRTALRVAFSNLHQFKR